jgi:hypothetical protein
MPKSGNVVKISYTPPNGSAKKQLETALILNRVMDASASILISKNVDTPKKELEWCIDDDGDILVWEDGDAMMLRAVMLASTVDQSPLTITKRKA